jgi:hypothetical protein
MIKKCIFFSIAILVFSAGATHRWGDSGHALALITANGGKARHPVHLSDTYGIYSIIVTAKVLPPYHGNAKVVLEGAPALPHEIHFSQPVIDLGFKEAPEFRDNTLYGLKPGHRIALWVVIKPENSAKYRASQKFNGMLTLALNDTETGKSILRVPMQFGEEEEKIDVQRQCNH